MILNQIFFVLSDSESNFLQRVRFWIKNFTTRQILKKNIFQKTTILKKKLILKSTISKKKN